MRDVLCDVDGFDQTSRPIDDFHLPWLRRVSDTERGGRVCNVTTGGDVGSTPGAMIATKDFVSDSSLNIYCRGGSALGRTLTPTGSDGLRLSGGSGEKCEKSNSEFHSFFSRVIWKVVKVPLIIDAT